MKEQFRLNINKGTGIAIECSTNGKNWSADIYVNTGDKKSTAKLAVRIIYMFERFGNRAEDYCPDTEDCPSDIQDKKISEKCPICWDRFFDEKVDELGK